MEVIEIANIIDSVADSEPPHLDHHCLPFQYDFAEVNFIACLFSTLRVEVNGYTSFFFAVCSKRNMFPDFFSG